MARTLFGGSRSSALAVSGNFYWLNGQYGGGSATESQRAWPTRIAGTFARFTCNTDANGTARTIILRKNSANATLIISPTDSTAGQFKDWTHTDHFALTDTYDFQLNGSGTLFAMFSFCGTFSADSGTAARYAGVEQTFGTNLVFGPFGSSWDTTESNVQFLVRAPATYQNMVLAVTVSAAGSNTFISRKNSANGNMTVTVGSGLTGIFEDTTHSDSVVSGDKWNAQINAGGAANLVARFGITAAHATDSSEVPFSMSFSFNAANQFAAFCAGNTAVQTTETNVSLPPGVVGLFSNLRNTVTVNSLASSATIVFRKNGTTGNQILTIGAGATGAFEDSTHTDVITETDLVALMASGGTSGSMTAGWGALTFSPVSFPAWFEPLSEPVRKLPGLHPSAQQFLAFNSQPFVPFGWFEPLSEPVRSPPRSPAAMTQFLAFNPQPFVPFSWFEPLSEPVRTLPGIHPSRQQFSALVINQSTIVPWGWFLPLSEPVRTPIGLKAHQQQFLAAPSQLRPNPTTTGQLAAIETKDIFLAGAQFWNRISSGEIGITEAHNAPGEIGISAPIITSASISIRII